MNDGNDIGAIILAGGKSKRMGTDKGLVLINSLSMVQHILNSVKHITNNIIVIANNKEYDRFGFPVYMDIIKNLGPVAGLYTGLYYSKYEVNIVLPCDVPYISVALLKYLLSKHNNCDVTIGVFGNKKEPLIGIYNTSVSSYLKDCLDNNQRKLRLVLDGLIVNYCSVTDFPEKEFYNINSSNDLINYGT